MGTGKTALVEVMQCGATGIHVTGSMFCACATNPALFSYYSNSTKCSTVVQVAWLPEVTKSHVTPSDSPGLAHAQPEVAQYPP
jgi:hypothetical protein